MQFSLPKLVWTGILTIAGGFVGGIGYEIWVGTKQVLELASFSVPTHWVFFGVVMVVGIGMAVYGNRRQQLLVGQSMVLHELTLGDVKAQLTQLAGEPEPTYFMSGYARPDPVKIRNMADRLNLLTASAKHYLGSSLNEDEFQVNPQLIQTLPSPSGHISRLAAKLLAQIKAWESQVASSEPQRRMGKLAKEIEREILAPENFDSAIRTLADEDDSTSLEKQEWLQKNYPRVWDFLKGIKVITTEHDFHELQDQLMKLITVQGMKKWDRTGEDDAWKLIEAQKIAIAVLFSKKKVPPKKHWWSS